MFTISIGTINTRAIAFDTTYRYSAWCFLACDVCDAKGHKFCTAIYRKQFATLVKD